MEGVMMSMTNNKEFNFYKSLDIDNINIEILAFHTSVHAFWTKQSVRSTFQKVLDTWCPDQTGQFYTKQPMKVNDVNLKSYYKVMVEQNYMGLAEGGFVECLFELWKIRSRIIKLEVKF